MNKVIRFEINPISEKAEKAEKSKTDKKDVKDADKTPYQVLWEIQRECMEIANRSVQYSWEWFNYGSDYKRENGEYLPKGTEQELFGKTFVSYVYGKVRGFAPNVASVSASTIVRDVCTRFNAKKGEFLKGDASIPSYKRNYPLPIVKKEIKINRFRKMVDGKKADEYYILDVPVLSREGAAKYDRDGRFRFKIVVNPKSGAQREFFANCSNIVPFVEVDGVIQPDPDVIENPRFFVTQSSIAWDKRNKKFFINLGYSFEPDKTDLVPERAVGVQLGYIVPCYCALSDSRKEFSINENEINEFRNRVEARRVALAQQTKFCGDGRIGHGRAKRVQPQMKIGDKIANFRDTCNHKYSRAIVDFAKRNKASTIIIEDLSKIAEENLFLKTWSYFDLQSKIKNKAAECGIAVVTIDPKYTSRRCSKCGNINEEEINLKTNRKFVCECCGFTTFYDRNAAINIATPGIEAIINERINAQGITPPKPKKSTKKKEAEAKKSK